MHAGTGRAVEVSSLSWEPRQEKTCFSKVGKNPDFMSIAQPSGFYWENRGFTRVILGFTGFTG